MIDRRKFLRAALFVAAAPIIVKAANIMPVRALVVPQLPRTIGVTIDPLKQTWTFYGYDQYGRETVEVIPATKSMEEYGIHPYAGSFRWHPIPIRRISVA